MSDRFLDDVDADIARIQAQLDRLTPEEKRIGAERLRSTFSKRSSALSTNDLALLSGWAEGSVPSKDLAKRFGPMLSKLLGLDE